MERGNRVVSATRPIILSTAFDEGLAHCECVQGRSSPLGGMTACPELQAVPVPTHLMAPRAEVSPNSRQVGVKNRREIVELPQDTSSL